MDSPRLAGAETAHHHAADRVEILVGEVGVEVVVEVRDLGERLHAVAPALVGEDVVLGLVEVVLVLDVAHDLLDHVLDGDEPRHAAVFVHDDRDVVAVGAEFLEQHVQALGFRHEHGGPEHLADVELLLGVEAQQVLREEDADHVVAVVLEDGETRGRLSITNGMNASGLSAASIMSVWERGKSDVADLRLGHLQHALDHRETPRRRAGDALESRVRSNEMQLLAILARAAISRTGARAGSAWRVRSSGGRGAANVRLVRIGDARLGEDPALAIFQRPASARRSWSNPCR